MPETDQPKRPIKHRSLVIGSGEALAFLRELDEPCPACGRGPKPARLAVLNEDPPKQETVHCTNCDYQTTRKPAQVRLKPMNSR